MDEHSFDVVASHLVATLEDLGIEQDLIEEVVATVGPLRGVFEAGHKNASIK